VDKLLQDETTAALIKQLNRSFTPPSRPFKRLSYVDAIAWLNEHGIQHDADDAEGNVIKDAEGKPVQVDHAVGDDIAEAAERKMTDIIGTPVFLHGFPAELKAFYMKKAKVPAGSDASHPVITESCDLLMPGVGEIVGGSMRISDIDELLAAYKREGIDPAPYYWFTDQRKYGTCEHGGYGLGVEVCLFFKTVCLRPHAQSSFHLRRVVPIIIVIVIISSDSWRGWRTGTPLGNAPCIPGPYPFFDGPVRSLAQCATQVAGARDPLRGEFAFVRMGIDGLENAVSVAGMTPLCLVIRVFDILMLDGDVILILAAGRCRGFNWFTRSVVWNRTKSSVFWRIYSHLKMAS